MLEWQNLLLEGKMEWGTTQLSREVVNVLKKMLDVEAISDEDFTSYTFSADKILDNPIPNLHEIRLFVKFPIAIIRHMAFYQSDVTRAIDRK